jgi:hypothetical protein
MMIMVNFEILFFVILVRSLDIASNYITKKQKH